MNSDQPTTPLNSDPPTPSMSIATGLLLMACCAIVFATHRESQRQRLLIEPETSLEILETWIGLLTNSLSLTGMVIVGIDAVKHRRLPVHPGWLLIFGIGCSNVISLTADWLHRYPWDYENSRDIYYTIKNNISMFSSTGSFFEGGIVFLGLFKDKIWWRAMTFCYAFPMFVLGSVFVSILLKAPTAFGMSTQSLNFMIYFMVFTSFGLMLVSFGLDIYYGIKRDWLHRVAIFVVLLQAAHIML